MIIEVKSNLAGQANRGEKAFTVRLAAAWPTALSFRFQNGEPSRDSTYEGLISAVAPANVD